MSEQLPPSLQYSLELFRESPEEWHAEWQRKHDFKVRLLTQNAELKARITVLETSIDSLRYLVDHPVRQEKEPVKIASRLETMRCATCAEETVIHVRSIENTFWCDRCKKWQPCPPEEIEGNIEQSGSRPPHGADVR